MIQFVIGGVRRALTLLVLSVHLKLVSFGRVSLFTVLCQYWRRHLKCTNAVWLVIFVRGGDADVVQFSAIWILSRAWSISFHKLLSLFRPPWLDKDTIKLGFLWPHFMHPVSQWSESNIWAYGGDVPAQASRVGCVTIYLAWVSYLVYDRSFDPGGSYHYTTANMVAKYWDWIIRLPLEFLICTLLVDRCGISQFGSLDSRCDSSGCVTWHLLFTHTPNSLGSAVPFSFTVSLHALIWKHCGHRWPASLSGVCLQGVHLSIWSLCPLEVAIREELSRNLFLVFWDRASAFTYLGPQYGLHILLFLHHAFYLQNLHCNQRCNQHCNRLAGISLLQDSLHSQIGRLCAWLIWIFCEVMLIRGWLCMNYCFTSYKHSDRRRLQLSAVGRGLSHLRYLAAAT
jgi:hypothetical protein